MGKIIKVVTAILVFITVNLYLGIQLIERVEVFRLENAPMAVDVVKDDFAGGIIAADINRDGDDEIIFEVVERFPDRRVAWIFDPLKKETSPGPFSGKRIFPASTSVFGVYLDKRSKSPVFRLLDYSTGSFVLKEVDIHGEIQKELPFDKTGVKLVAKEFGLSRPVFTDLESDGRDEMLIILRSYYIHSPRCVVCFESETGKLLWEYDMGTSVQDMEIADLDGDGKKEIVLSTHAINNGARMNGTDDAHSYVIVLDHRGNLRWKEETGDWYSRVQSTTADLDGDGFLEIVTAMSSHRVHAEVKGKLFVFDGLTGKKKAYYPLPHASFSKPFVRMTRDRRPRVYVGDAAGCIRMFDDRLNLLKTIHGSAPIHILNASPPSPGWPCLIALTHERLAAYDWDLERKVFDFAFMFPLFKSEEISALFFSPFHMRGTSGILVAADKLLWVYPVEGSLYRTVKTMFTSGALAAAAGLILFTIFFVYSQRAVHAPDTRLLRTSRRKVKETSRFLHALRELARQIKNPISTISWTAEKINRNTAAIEDIKTRENYTRLAEFLAEDGKILKQQANHLLRLVQVYKPRFRDVALKPLLQHLSEHYRTVTAENIHVRLEMEEDVSLYLDEELFKEAVVNLVDNALDAMTRRGSGQLTVSVVPVLSPTKGRIEQVEVEVEDTGSGIEESDLSRVFDPFFTRKEKGKGTGIGLFICKRIIDAHGGTIDIYSRKNFGTRVTVTLPVKRKRREK